jgi:MipA family protein
LKYSLTSSLALFATFATTSVLAADDTPRWGLGLGAVVSDNPYAGRDTRYTPLPLITYDSERFFFRGITGGVHLFDNELLQLDFIVQGDFGGIDADDFGRRELALNGIDRDLLEDRDDTAQAGFQLGFEGRLGELKLEFVADVLDASGGYEASAEYGYPITFGERLTLTPMLGVKWLSADTADYYYGTLDAEVARGVVRYRPGAVAIPEVGLDVKYNLGGRWMLLGNLSYGALPSKISDSPLVDDDRAAGLMIGVIRAF